MEVPVFSRLNTAIRNTRATREHGIDALVELLESYLTDPDIERVRDAYEYGARMHAGQVRKSGESYIFHPLAVARILAEMRLDATTLIAALLHDVIEDTPALRDEVESRFGDAVAIVEGVSKLDKVSDRSREEAQAENLRKLLLAMTDDIRVILVKLADRLHNMRTLGSMRADKRRRIARETLEIYAPIAHRLGIHTLRVELEDLGFANLYPHRHRVLSKSVSTITGRRKNLIREVEDKLSRRLSDEGIGAAVFGRRKNLYSFYLKMRSKHLRFLDVMDLYGFRVIVDSEDACYRALGVVHSVYKPISQMFDDYIACPKINGYQSLHTTLIGPKGVKIEIQIRTREMNHVAESGVAAHWLYKLGPKAGRQAPQQRAREWLFGLMDMESRANSAVDFIENVRVDLSPDEVYVFTPKGRICRLPKGATPVDFAYAIHTDLGNSFVAARVDQVLVPMSTLLESGQQVEIITAKHQNPNATWLSFVKTAKARSNILHYLRHQRSDEARRLGRRLLEMALRDLDVRWRNVGDEQIQAALAAIGEPDMQKLYEAIGNGRRLAPLVARQMLPQQDATGATKPRPLAVQGTEGLVVDFAKCCQPIPGDDIRGQLRIGRGIVIHRASCQVGLRKDDPQGAMDVVWADEVKGDFIVGLYVQGENKRGMLGWVATALAEEGCNIEHVRISEGSGDIAELQLDVTVSSRAHLARAIRRVRRLPTIIKVERGGKDSRTPPTESF